MNSIQKLLTMLLGIVVKTLFDPRYGGKDSGVVAGLSNK